MGASKVEGYTSSFAPNIARLKKEFNLNLKVTREQIDINSSIVQLSFEFKKQSAFKISADLKGMSAFESRGGPSREQIVQMLEDIDTKLLGYEGKALDKLSPEEARALVQKGGFFSVENTAARMADFVLSGAGESESMLKAGREGVLLGLKMAEEAWGGELPKIAYESTEKAIEMIDRRFEKLGIPLLSESI